MFHTTPYTKVKILLLWEIFIFQNSLTVHKSSYDAAIVAIAMHAVQRGGPAIDAYERHACQHPLLCWQLTDWVETSVLLLMRQLPQQQHGGTVGGCSVPLCAHARLNFLHADWLAGCLREYKRRERRQIVSLVGGGPGRRHDKLGTRRIKDL